MPRLLISNNGRQLTVIFTAFKLICTKILKNVKTCCHSGYIAVTIINVGSETEMLLLSPHRIVSSSARDPQFLTIK